MATDAARITIARPNDKQRMFLTATCKYVAYGGARGGGKSWAIRAKAILLCAKHAGITVCIIRHSYPELTQNHIKPIRAMIPTGAARYNDQRKEIVFPNGSTILFRYCANDRDLDNFQGTEYDVLFIDEATQFTEEQFRVLTACVRGTNDFPKRVYLTCNPGGIGHAWVKRLFIDRKYKSGENAEDYAFIKAVVGDNYALMQANPDYVKQLEALAPKLRKAWLEGDWNIFEGQFFEEFRDDPAHYADRRYTHVIDPFEPPRHWTIHRSLDFGYAKPFSAAWWGVDYDGTIYRILELYGCTDTPNEGVKWDPDRIFTEIRRIETTHPWLVGREISGVADPSIWDSSRGESIAETAAKHYITYTPGDNNRLAGWMQVHYRLRFDEDGIPGMYVFSGCKAFIRTMPLLTYDRHRVEDIDTTLEDHVADEVRYFCMSRPIKPVTPKEDDPLIKSPLHEIFGLTHEDIAKVPRKRIIISD